MLELLNPIPHTVPTDVTYRYGFAECAVNDYYSPEIFGKAITVLLLADKQGEIVPTDKKIELRHWNLYFGTQGLINHCINNAETINSRLLAYLFRTVKNTNTRDELIEMDFMSLRNYFSIYIKGSPLIKAFETFKIIPKLSSITSLFFRFITDRNIYTHGRLMLLLSDDTLLIQHRFKGQLVYSEINTEILKSYNGAYDKLSAFFSFLEIIQFPQSDGNALDKAIDSLHTTMLKQ